MKITDDTLLEYLDGKFSNAERLSIKTLIETDPDLKKRYETLRSINTTLKLDNVRSPSGIFVRQVMRSILRPDVQQERFFNNTRYFVLGLIILAFLSTIYFLAIKFYPSLSGLIANKVTVSNKTIYLEPAVQLLSTDLIFKLVFYVNGIVGLLLFEKAILSPFFLRRRQQLSM
jgi:hypothetical protein